MSNAIGVIPKEINSYQNDIRPDVILTEVMSQWKSSKIAPWHAPKGVVELKKKQEQKMAKQIYTVYKQTVYVTDAKTGNFVRIYLIDEAGNETQQVYPAKS